jgi:tetrapyrrole methylase family protein/MazG family protein
MTLISLIVPALDALGQTPRELQVVDVQVLLECYYPHLSVDRPALIGPLTDDAQCQELGKLLQLAYPDAHNVTVVSDVEGTSPALQSLPLERLDQAVLNGGALLYLPPLSCVGAVESFQDIVAHLRSPSGCPWDRKQTHRSMRQGFQEEAYEVLDALDADRQRAERVSFG